MNKAQQILDRLNHLREYGSIPWSQCSGALLATIHPLLEAGVVAKERSGAGRRLTIRNQSAYEAFCLQSFPDVAVTADTSSRIAGVARFRDSKVLQNDTPEIISVRSLELVLLRHNGQPVDVAEATRTHNLLSFTVDDRPAYALHGSCALIEGPALFFEFEKLGLPAKLAIYAGGRYSGRLQDWLVGQKSSEFSLWHLPDYDPVGLSEFSRLHSQLGDRARLYVPEDLEEKFRRYSKPQLLKNEFAQTLMRQLRVTNHLAVKRVVTLIDQFNAGLEQEVLLID